MILNPKKILNRKASSKHDLRMALAQVLGVECPQFDAPKFEETAKCRVKFLDFYYKTTGVEYSWSAKDAACLNHIIKKMHNATNAAGQQVVVDAFGVMLEKLPKWYKDNLSLSIINSKFNEIISTIRNGNNRNNHKSRTGRFQSF